MVGAYFGLTPKKYQSGETDWDGGVSKVNTRLSYSKQRKSNDTSQYH